MTSEVEGSSAIIKSAGPSYEHGVTNTKHAASQVDDAQASTECSVNDKSVTRIPDDAVADHEDDISDLIYPAPAIASSRYNRQMLIPSIAVKGQQRISQAKVLVVGLGGLGSPAALYLAGAGVGTLGLLDDDHVEVTNLHRQVVHRESSVQQAMTKVESASRGCRDLNSEIELVQHALRLDVSSSASANSILEIVKGYDIILDCTDNPATRYLINDLCVVLEKTLVSGAAQRLEGQVIVLNYPLPDRDGRGPCYRCVFPVPPSPEMVKGCGEIGILGPVVGTIGTLMATETLRLIVKGESEGRKPSMLLYNAWPQDPRSMFRNIGLKGKRSECVACGETDVLRSVNKDKITRESIVDGGVNYVTFCGISQESLLESNQRISATEFVDGFMNRDRKPGSSEPKSFAQTLIVDVRELYEIEMGTKIKMGINIPMSRILSSASLPDELTSSITNHDSSAVLFLCQRGNDSQVAAKRLIDWRAKSQNIDLQELQPASTGVISETFIGDIVGGLTAVEKCVLKGTF